MKSLLQSAIMPTQTIGWYCAYNVLYELWPTAFMFIDANKIWPHPSYGLMLIRKNVVFSNQIIFYTEYFNPGAACLCAFVVTCPVAMSLLR